MSIKSNVTVISARVSSRYGTEDPANWFGGSMPERRHLQKHPTPVLGTCHIVRKLFGLEEHLLTTAVISLVKPAITNKFNQCHPSSKTNRIEEKNYTIIIIIIIIVQSVK
jgi:hypothetical protein